MVRGIRYLASSKTAVRNDRRLGRVLADVVDSSHFEPVTGRRHALVLREDFSRFT